MTKTKMQEGKLTEPTQTSLAIEEKTIIRAEAKRLGLGVSTYIRMILVKEIREVIKNDGNE